MLSIGDGIFLGCCVIALAAVIVANIIRKSVIATYEDSP